MASKAAQPEAEKADIEELLDTIDKTLDRTKVLYEQYFLGMQKQPPTQIHTDCERRLRDLQQMQIRNTGLRYRFATLQQKFGSYNSYWRRTLKQIENGTYIRNLQKISRQAALTGEAIPEEILAAMPKRMREQVKRDREQALSIAKRRHDTQNDGRDDFADDDAAAVIGEAPEVVRQIPRGGAHVLADDEGDLDFEAFFASVENKADDTQENIPAYQEKPTPAARPAPVAARPRAPILRHELSVEDDDEATSFQPPPAPVQPRGTGPVPSGPQHPRAASVPGPPVQRGAVPPPARVQPGAVPPPGAQQPPAAGPQFPRGATQPGTPPPRPGTPPPVPQRATGPIPVVPMPARPGQPPQRATGPIPTVPQQSTTSIPTIVSQTDSIPTIPGQTQPIGTFPGQTQSIPTTPGTQRMPAIPADPNRQTGPIPVQRATSPIPTIPNATVPSIPARPGVPAGGIPRPGGAPAPSQVSRPNPIAPGSSTARAPVQVESMQGPFPRASQQPSRPAAPPVNARQEPPKVAPPRPQPSAPRPPPGMSDADVNALHATYVKAKKAVGEEAGPGSYGKLLQTINAQAPKIMEQYKAKGVEFTVVVKDNQVVIKAKPKT